MTNSTIVQVIQQSSLSDESKLNSLALFALLRMHLNCNFASYLRYLDGPARGDLVAFTTAMQVTQAPLKQQVVLLAGFLDALEAGGSFTLQQYADALMNQIRHVEEEKFVERVVLGQPAPLTQLGGMTVGPAIGNTAGLSAIDFGVSTPQAPSLPPAPAGPAGWGAYQGPPPPGPQAALPMQVPQSQLPVDLAVGSAVEAPPFEVGQYVDAGKYHVATNQTPPDVSGGVLATHDAWALAANAATAPQKEVDIPDADPIPAWFKPGGRAVYELADQKIVVTIMQVSGRHATIVADDGTLWYGQPPAYLTESSAPYELNWTLPGYRLQELENRQAKTIVHMQPCLLEHVVDFVRISPLDGGKLHISLELWAKGDKASTFFYCLRLQSADLTELARVDSDVLLANWTIQLEQAVYHLHLKFDAPEVELAVEPEVDEPEPPAVPKKKRAPRKKKAKS